MLPLLLWPGMAVPGWHPGLWASSLLLGEACCAVPPFSGLDSPGCKSAYECPIAFTTIDPTEYLSSPYLEINKTRFRCSEREVVRSYLMESKEEIIEFVRLVHLGVG